MIDFKKLKDLYAFLESIEDSILANSPVFKLYNLKSGNKWLMVWSTILSSRTTDKAMMKVLPVLASKFSEPKDVLGSDLQELEELFRPLGFYRSKARMFLDFNKTIVEKYGGILPRSLEELTKLPGIGLKVASIILNDLFGEGYIGVDTHVFRILNRVGVVRAGTPDRMWRILHTESVRERLTTKIYLNLNRYLVAFGQTICKHHPYCHMCDFRDKCSYYRSL
ncbi:MAG: hypothetical protein RMJ51_04055 [Candidatus Calescibacterium sp.]|nr:hypothetical protein [Candidatus Calescibacterium sp.]MCX7971790.1 hypothetical protein [bacterium]MDW8195396.1 hypothetical protein [Candidatus Calescibacterium sp.]